MKIGFPIHPRKNILEELKWIAQINLILLLLNTLPLAGGSLDEESGNC